MAGISSKALNFGAPENKYKYNGIEKENDLQIEIYDAQLRELDGQIGRWWEIDPKIEDMEMWSPYISNNDNPLRYSDPLGNEGEECCGGTLTGVISWLKDVAIDAAQRANYRINEITVWAKGTIDQAGENARRRWDAGVDPLHQMLADPMTIVGGPVSSELNLVKGALRTDVEVLKAVEKYEVGMAKDLSKKSVKDGLEIHHTPQSQPAKQIIKEYEKSTAPSIVLPTVEHRSIPTLKGTKTAGNARQQLAKDIKDLRKNTEAPNSSLQKLIELNKKTYPEVFKKN